MGATVAVFFPLFVAIFFSLFAAIVLPLIMSGKEWKAAEEKARARRMAEHRMNARLLRLDICCLLYTSRANNSRMFIFSAGQGS